MNTHFSLAAAITCLVGLLAQSSIAHVPFIEEEMARRVGRVQADEDFSFNKPFVI